MCSSRKPQTPPPVVAAPVAPPDRLASALKPAVSETLRKRGSRNPLRIDLSATGAAPGAGSTNGLNVV